MNAQENKTLDKKQQAIAGIAALTATRDLAMLRIQLHQGLDAGLTVNEIKEILVQLYAYCGFPGSLNGISMFMAVIKEREAKGIHDDQGKIATVDTTVATGKYERGRKTLELLTKTPQAKPAPGFGEFAPRIDAFLKEHLFADIFDSDVLTYQQRELATISALAAMTGTEAQLKSHIAIGINTGITQAQLLELASLIEKHVNRTQANTIRTVLSVPATPLLEKDLMVRIAEIEIIPDSLNAYVDFLNEEAAVSMEIEPGVIAIFPMRQKDNPSQIRIVEIYAGKAAYESHLQTPHFQKYKTSTVKMVKSLRLVDMEKLDAQTMQEVFRKIR